jgi:hypothetical protein
MESVVSFFSLGQFCNSVCVSQRMEGDGPLTRGSLGSSEGCGTRVTPAESVLTMGCCDSFSDILLH